MKTIIVLLLTLLTLFVSCSSQKSKVEERIDEKSKTEFGNLDSLKIERFQTLSDISQKFNTNSAFDTVRYKLTSQYQFFLRNNDRVIIDRFRIIDIELIDTTYLVSIVKQYSERKMYVDFTCTQAQIEILVPDIMNNKRIVTNTTGKFLILKIKKLKKLKLKIDSEYYEEANDEYELDPANYVELVVANSFICKGDLIDIVINKNIEKVGIDL